MALFAICTEAALRHKLTFECLLSWTSFATATDEITPLVATNYRDNLAAMGPQLARHRRVSAAVHVRPGIFI